MSDNLFDMSVGIASLVGIGFSAWAAWRSAGSARLALEAADRITHRQTLREIAVNANEVLIEHGRITTQVRDLKLEYQVLFVGDSSNSNLPQYLARVEEKLKHASGLADDARLFAGSASSLIHSPIGDLDRIANRLHGSLATLRGYREDFHKEQQKVAKWLREKRERQILAK